MSRAFVREQDIEALEELPDRLISPHPNDVTDEGMNSWSSMLEARVRLTPQHSEGRTVRRWPSPRVICAIGAPGAGFSRRMPSDQQCNVIAGLERDGERRLAFGSGRNNDPADTRSTLMMIRRLYRIERKVPYPATALPDLHRPARPVVVMLPHQSTHHFRSELARSRVVRQFHAGRVVLQVSKAGVTENEDITRH